MRIAHVVLVAMLAAASGCIIQEDDRPRVECTTRPQGFDGQSVPSSATSVWRNSSRPGMRFIVELASSGREHWFIGVACSTGLSRSWTSPSCADAWHAEMLGPDGKPVSFHEDLTYCAMVTQHSISPFENHGHVERWDERLYHSESRPSAPPGAYTWIYNFHGFDEKLAFSVPVTVAPR